MQRLPKNTRTILRSRRALARRSTSTALAHPAPQTPARDALFISTVWPERSSSAAGVRTDDLISSFLARGHSVAYACTSTPNSHTQLLEQRGVSTFCCAPNREGQLLEVLGQARPAVVVFDRFFAEEMFSFRVREALPGALRVLDLQDCHALREGRQQLSKRGAGMGEVMACRPDASSPALLRELSAIHRSDLTLVCSPTELASLTRHYGVPGSKLTLAPFFAPPSPHAAAPPPFAPRQHFMMIGNWMHPPNLDSARWACAEVWPALRRRLRAGGVTAELHLYGAYAPSSASQLHSPATGVHLEGFAPDLDVMTRYRVCLAPLRYGAGLKGKVVDSWWHGLPVCTTLVGAEGMHGVEGAHGAERTHGAEAAHGVDAVRGGAAADPQPFEAAAADWGGLCGAGTADEVAADAARLYTDAALWGRCQRRGFELLAALYDREQRLDAVHAAIHAAQQDLGARRAADFVQAMLWQQGTRSTEYFSRWIELKERRAACPAAESDKGP